MMKPRNDRPSVRRKPSGVRGKYSSKQAKKLPRRRSQGGSRPPGGPREPPGGSQSRPEIHSPTWREMLVATGILVIVGFAFYEGTMALVGAISLHGVWGGLLSLAALVMSVMEHAIYAVRAASVVRSACALAIMVIGSAATRIGENLLRGPYDR
jgi:hypothetical protein